MRVWDSMFIALPLSCAAGHSVAKSTYEQNANRGEATLVLNWFEPVQAAYFYTISDESMNNRRAGYAVTSSSLEMMLVVSIYFSNRTHFLILSWS